MTCDIVQLLCFQAGRTARRAGELTSYSTGKSKRLKRGGKCGPMFINGGARQTQGVYTNHCLHPTTPLRDHATPLQKTMNLKEHVLEELVSAADNISARGTENLFS